MPRPAKTLKAPALPLDAVTHHYDPAEKTVTVQVGNINAKDAQFITSIIALLCDPTLNIQAELVRNGQLNVTYGRNTGRAICVPAFARQ